ncbi:RAN BINDING protein 1 [Striga asiatica]|uniref:RAN BINDING protein 1 n=1 Tax=Striga asiatica TaxID=4170 RepID=A0A5A7PSJ9_STRAF|nr:RAN BINDING protein 1 [Striga asiatica]
MCVSMCVRERRVVHTLPVPGGGGAHPGRSPPSADDHALALEMGNFPEAESCIRQGLAGGVGVSKFCRGKEGQANLELLDFEALIEGFDLATPLDLKRISIVTDNLCFINLSKRCRRVEEFFSRSSSSAIVVKQASEWREWDKLAIKSPLPPMASKKEEEEEDHSKPTAEDEDTGAQIAPIVKLHEVVVAHKQLSRPNGVAAKLDSKSEYNRHAKYLLEFGYQEKDQCSPMSTGQSNFEAAPCVKNSFHEQNVLFKPVSRRSSAPGHFPSKLRLSTYSDVHQDLAEGPLAEESELGGAAAMLGSRGGRIQCRAAMLGMHGGRTVQVERPADGTDLPMVVGDGTERSRMFFGCITRSSRNFPIYLSD